MMIEPSLASKLEAPCLLSVVVPVFNEEAVLPAFHQRLGAVLGDLGDDCEVLYVDDGSTDRSATILAQLQAADRRVGVARFTRNFGKEQAMSAGPAVARRRGDRHRCRPAGSPGTDPADARRLDRRRRNGQHAPP